jgi:hypothetical protein
MEKRSFHFGFSTILISFVMICIVTFCALALLTANADYRLSRKVAERTSAYYEAEEDACHLLSDIDRMLSDCYTDSVSRDDYEKKVFEAASEFADENPPVTVTKDDGTVISWENSYGDNQTLDVSLRISWPPENNGSCYTLTEWRTISSAPESDNQTLDLIGKETNYER